MCAGVPKVSAGLGTMATRAWIFNPREREKLMNNIIYIVGAVVIVIAVLSFFGLR
jgi:ABC-type dipeptide/oligopeptide/nickel transport system permease subunit